MGQYEANVRTGRLGSEDPDRLGREVVLEASAPYLNWSVNRPGLDDFRWHHCRYGLYCLRGLL